MSAEQRRWGRDLAGVLSTIVLLLTVSAAFAPDTTLTVLKWMAWWCVGSTVAVLAWAALCWVAGWLLVWVCLLDARLRQRSVRAPVEDTPEWGVPG